MLSGETAPQAAWLAEVRRDLADRHAEFSFLQIALWRQTAGLRTPVRGSGKLSRAGTNGKVNVDVSAESVMLLPGDSGQSRAPNDAGLLLRYLYPRITRSGQTISDELDRLRGVQTQVDRRHAQLTQQMRRRRGQLVDGLLAGHIAVQTLLEMAEKNDSLIGRLVKARPLFAQLRRIIMAGPDDAITALPTSRSKPESEEEEDKDGGEMRNGYSTA
ncbi:unnamed protein product [Protopolystoma xenopodis]|uniref:Uncharacterized protein n=1 Tax=Protopolystoma xenopodis TaxID=117903 RepID=A0A448WCS2_9PLAT|nr:unnamed protein product [Protopolystoma xenopodis]